MKTIKKLVAAALAAVAIFSYAPCAAATGHETIRVTVKAVEQIEPAAVEHSQRDLAELARIIYWESRGETQEGQLAVANVVLNRVASPDFPDTIKGVVSQANQFSPYSRSDYYTVTIPEEYFTVAQMALAGDTAVDDGVYWFRSDAKPSKWYSAAYTISIGGHHFYKI